MSQRERLMVLVLGTFLLGGLGFAAYTLAVKPILDKRKELAALNLTLIDKQGEERDVQEKNKRLKEYQRRSLPAEYEFARNEYEAMLLKLLRESNAPKGFGLTFEPSKSNSPVGIPLLHPESKTDKTPVYRLVVFKIEMKGADVGSVTEFLRRYYQLNLLHQITFFEMKREGNVTLGPDGRNQYERDDLTVNITTEGIVLNGAQVRQSVLPIPMANAAALGGIGLTAMEQLPSTSRGILPEQFEQLLATRGRDYYQIVAKDPFHGTLPTPPPEPKKTYEPPAIVIPPKPDFSDEIYYSTKFTTIEGSEQSVEILIRDKVNNEDYTVVLSQNGERVKARVNKYEYHLHKTNPNEQKKKVYTQDTLEISKYTMSTKHDFKVYGLDGDALILGEKPTGLASAAKADAPKTGTRGGPPSPPKSVSLPPPDPKAALIGGLVVTAPQAERFYRWPNGEPLSKVVELTGKEADAAVRRAQSSLLVEPAVSGATGTSPIAVTEK